MGDIPVIGIDLGYGQVKVAGPGYRASFPALVAEKVVWSESAGLVEWDNHHFLVGEAALSEQHHRYAVRMDKADTLEELAKYQVALALASRHYDSSVFGIATGLPPMYWKSLPLRQQLVDKLSGSFRFKFEGRSYDITVAGVTVDPQAGAAFYDFLLTEDAEPADRELLGLRTITVDVGHRTTDLAFMAGRKAAMGSRSILTAELGMWAVYEETARLLFAEHRLNLTPSDIDSYLRKGGSLKLSGSELLLGPYLAKAVEPVAHTLAAAVARQTADLRLWDAVLLVGGGAPLFREVLTQQLGIPVRLARDPAYANAAGFFKRQLER
ncbi:MAG TPA: ParM/StbA family protein [Symbiobacteriaceae bacterium]